MWIPFFFEELCQCLMFMSVYCLICIHGLGHLGHYSGCSISKKSFTRVLGLSHRISFKPPGFLPQKARPRHKPKQLSFPHILRAAKYIYDWGSNSGCQLGLGSSSRAPADHQHHHINNLRQWRKQVRVCVGTWLVYTKDNIQSKNGTAVKIVVMPLFFHLVGYNWCIFPSYSSDVFSSQNQTRKLFG